MLAAYRRALEGASPYVVATRPVWERLHDRPLGLELRQALRFDPTRQASAPFLRRLERLDRIVYGPLALAMPRWAFYDCAELPGLICGFAGELEALSPRLRDAWGPEPEGGPVPLSMCMTVPMLQPNRWLTYVLCDLHEAFPGLTPPSLRVLSLSLACALTGAGQMQGVTQWASPKLASLACFSPLRLRAAWVPAHTLPATCVVDFATDAAAVERALAREPPPPTVAPRWIDVGDAAVLQALQRELEAGVALSVVGGPRHHGASVVVPVSDAAVGAS